jgi:RNA polymerase subunit RPABC4/transcription elongation factor Spt4
VLGSDDTRVVCPNCHQVTPSGAFCAHCGQPLR